MQTSVQHHVDAAVAKTINLPADATPADMRAIYLAAWRAGVKGDHRLPLRSPFRSGPHPRPLPGRSPAPRCRSATLTAAAVTRASASSGRRRPGTTTQTFILNGRWCDHPVPAPRSPGFIGGNHGRSAGCVAPGHRVSPAQSRTRPARRFPSAGITRVRCWESPSGRSHLASQPSLRTISRGKFPGRVRGLAPPLVSQAPSPCSAPLAILRAGRPDGEGLWSAPGGTGQRHEQAGPSPLAGGKPPP